MFSLKKKPLYLLNKNHVFTINHKFTKIHVFTKNHVFIKIMLSPKTTFSHKTIFSPKAMFSLKAMFSPKTIFTPKTMFSPQTVFSQKKQFSSTRPTGPIWSSSRNVRVSVFLFVWCPFSCGIFWSLFFPHFPKSDFQKILRFGILWEKCWKEVVSELNILIGMWSKIGAQKKIVFCWFCLTKHRGNHASQWIRDLWSKGISLILAYL